MTENSVDEILQECNRMLAIPCDDRIDLIYAEKDLKKAMSELETKFKANEVYNDKVFNLLKHECNKQAIRVESCLAGFDSDLDTRLKLRCEVKDIMILLNNRIDRLRKDGEYFVICQVLYDYAFVEDIYEQSKNIIFSLSNDEKDRLRRIKLKEVN